MTQAGSPQGKATPVAPAPPPVQGSPDANVVTPGMLTLRNVAALKARAEVLSTQLRSAANRRSSIQSSLRGAVGADKTGLEARLAVLDARIARLETDIDENGKQLASIPAQLAGGSQGPFPGFNPGNANKFMDNMVPIVIVFTLFVLAPIAVSMARYVWKRGSAPRQAAESPENTLRLERMEQAIDTIAIEIERVSEGQRFVTRLLAEGRPASSIGVGQNVAQPVAIPVGEKFGANR